MKKVTQAINTLETLFELVKIQNNEINRLRYIVARYNMKHGEEVFAGITELPETSDFHIQQHSLGVTCKIVDYKKVGIDSDFMRMQKIINSLNEKQ
jgi:hypothetical protein